MSDGFYLTYSGSYPALVDLRRFWESALTEAGLVDSDPWERTGEVVEQVATQGDLAVELSVFLEGDDPCEVSIEGHWSTSDTPAAYRSILRTTQDFARATGGRLEDFDSNADLQS